MLNRAIEYAKLGWKIQDKNSAKYIRLVMAYKQMEKIFKSEEKEQIRNKIKAFNIDDLRVV